MRILGIDPGYAIVGYGVINAARGRYETVEYGAVTTKAGEYFGLRLLEIYEGMTELIETLRPQAAAVEKLYFLNNKTTGIGVAEARGIILLTPVPGGGAPIRVYPHAGEAGGHRLWQGTEAPGPGDDGEASEPSRHTEARRRGGRFGAGHLPRAGGWVQRAQEAYKDKRRDKQCSIALQGP